MDRYVEPDLDALDGPDVVEFQPVGWVEPPVIVPNEERLARYVGSARIDARLATALDVDPDSPVAVSAGLAHVAGFHSPRSASSVAALHDVAVRLGGLLRYDAVLELGVTDQVTPPLRATDYPPFVRVVLAVELGLLADRSPQLDEPLQELADFTLDDALEDIAREALFRLDDAGFVRVEPG